MSLTCIKPEKLYQKDPKIRPEDVKILQDWLTTQPHLPKIEEFQLIPFLHSCYYSIEMAKTTIDKYFTARTLHPEIFLLPSNDIIKKTCSAVMSHILPKKTPQGYMIYMGTLVDCPVENYHFTTTMIMLNCVLALYAHLHGFEEGLVLIFDCKGYTLSHLTRVNLLATKHWLNHLQEGTPVRIKEIHIVNITPVMDKVLAIIKPILSGHLFQMIQLHSSPETLHKYVPKECLPEDIGGELPPYAILKDQPLNAILENLDLIKWHETQTVDESKRTKTDNTIESTFGAEGTFKKLQID
ncbi:hypothetical protein Zmor_001342 [Zophobas morio]|uniref:CRAL-TRIO domain-containing protein n=1 Tax=Zophobas morio TaxID=2755281 RepID=A0AA38J736_9CUCU|nr:hypothetical protein Zmor_001342 [Zophobas morio]